MFFLLLKKIIFFYIFLYTSKSFSGTPIQFYNDTKHYLEVKNIFKNHHEKLSYALGTSLGNYINQSFEKQKKIGVRLNKYDLLKGVRDAITGHTKIPEIEVSLLLKELEDKLKNATIIQLKKDAKENLIHGKLYMEKLLEMKGVKKTNSGLLYIIKREGKEKILKNNAQITVHYRGSFINGIEFDNSYQRGQPISLMLKDVILGWQEGLRYIGKGGKIKLVIPPNLGYGEREISGIPGNSTLIFDIELLDVINVK
ncbi:MAG: FKBP-type peptidyl-prolyl cis-trans isomerase [Buchnera aphidicola (Pentalonia nigronervosa)]|uniref:Peptidyl-prolyl cis-trans isomerase n=1 Tax=Buchnera aphidicola (Pentalonia nigronervosa) TaxID=1309793 RepID=A0A7H1AZ02_9GAMM|nr:MAG: FKBP-type peptidyl-prolyl cis-trans isomerase [Buchnera aphidicola (Pentalonia nigronervosa)]